MGSCVCACMHTLCVLQVVHAKPNLKAVARMMVRVNTLTTEVKIEKRRRRVSDKELLQESLKRHRAEAALEASEKKREALAQKCTIMKAQLSELTGRHARQLQRQLSKTMTSLQLAETRILDAKCAHERALDDENERFDVRLQRLNAEHDMNMQKLEEERHCLDVKLQKMQRRMDRTVKAAVNEAKKRPRRKFNK